MGGITRGKKVAVYWRWPKATGNIQGEWHEATVKSSNRRGLGTMTVEYDDGGSQDTVNIEEENVVWMDPVGNIDAEEDLRNEVPQRVAPRKQKRNIAAEEDLQNEDPQRVAPKRQKRKKCEHGKCVATARRRLFRSWPFASSHLACCCMSHVPACLAVSTSHVAATVPAPFGRHVVALAFAWQPEGTVQAAMAFRVAWQG